jgi:hypothetical protein
MHLWKYFVFIDHLLADIYCSTIINCKYTLVIVFLRYICFFCLVSFFLGFRLIEKRIRNLGFVSPFASCYVNLGKDVLFFDIGAHSYTF